MKHTCHRSFCATVAISAALSLGSTPLLAQQAAPSLDLPPAAEAPPPQSAASPSTPQQTPAIVLPDFEERFRDAAAKDARDEAAPAEAPAARASRTRSADAQPRESRSSAQAAASSPSSAQSAPAAAGGLPSGSEPLAAAPVELPDAAREDAPVATAEPAAAREPMDVPDGAIVAALLGVAGLGAAGFLATRRRRRDYDEEYEEEAYEPVADEALPATATEHDFVDEPITSIPEELALRRPAPEVEAADEQAVADEPVASQSFVMPEGPVPTGEARRRLIEEMVAAPPDEANPFTAYVPRRKRARIILQAREKRLRQQATEPFDWRTYRPPEDDEAASSSPVDAGNADR